MQKKFFSKADLMTADLSGITSLDIQGLGLTELPEDFFAGAESLRALCLKSNPFNRMPSGIPGTVRELFCCNFGSRSGGGGGSYTPPPARRPYTPPALNNLPESGKHGERWVKDNVEYIWVLDDEEGGEGSPGRWVPQPTLPGEEPPVVDLDALPIGLEKLYLCETWLGDQPLDFSRFKNLRELFLNDTGISNVVAWPPNVVMIYANDNQLTAVPELPTSMQVVELNNNQLTSLPPVAHTQLRMLRVNENKLTSLPHLPDTLVELRAEGNQLTSLPQLPPIMVRLYIGRNKLTSLPQQLPAMLEELYCSYNQLTSLPALPAGLLELYCDNNNLRSLGTLPAGMVEVYCGYNKLRTHPELPASCTEFNGIGNQFDQIAIYATSQNMARYQMKQASKTQAFA